MTERFSAEPVPYAIPGTPSPPQTDSRPCTSPKYSVLRFSTRRRDRRGRPVRTPSTVGGAWDGEVVTLGDRPGRGHRCAAAPACCHASPHAHHRSSPRVTNSRVDCEEPNPCQHAPSARRHHVAPTQCCRVCLCALQERHEAILGDVSGAVVTIFKVLRNGVAAVARRVAAVGRRRAVRHAARRAAAAAATEAYAFGWCRRRRDAAASCASASTRACLLRLRDACHAACCMLGVPRLATTAVAA